MLTDLLLTDKERFYRIAFSYVHNKDDALDIIQDSIHKALKTVHKLNNTEGLRSWFIRIVINTSLDLLRKQKREMIVDDDTLEFVSPNSNDHYENLDLVRVLDSLSPKYRMIIILKFFEDLTIREIAEILNENENTIKTRLYNGLKALRVQIKDKSCLEAN
nr:RNA polymerase sigma factor [Lysinibacillus timonensis]